MPNEGPLTPEQARKMIGRDLAVTGDAMRQLEAASQDFVCSVRQRCTHDWRVGNPDTTWRVCRGCGSGRRATADDIAHTRRAELLAKRAEIDKELKELETTDAP